MSAPSARKVSAKLSDPLDWVDRYGDALLRFARARVASRELAEDLVQETFLAAFRHRGQFDGKSAFGTWLVAILRRKIVDYHRQRGSSAEAADESLESTNEAFASNGKWSTSSTKWRETPTQLAENSEFWAVFHDCMADLPVHLAQAFQLRELASVSLDETGRMIGITRENVAVRLHRARLLLRQCLERKWFRAESGEST